MTSWITRKDRLLAGTLIAGASAMALTSGALAQEATSAEDAADGPTEEIIVTGTRLRQANVASPVPIQTLDAETIDLSGATNISDLVRNLPVAGVPGLTTGNSNFLVTASGINTVELRNLAEDRTLVLVNGRRHVGGLPASQAVDFNMIPIELIERVEVVTGGASAVYGSDALAGVVNVILNDKFEGLVVNSQGGISDRNDNENFRLAATAGSNFAEGRGNAVVNASWSKENGVFARDRDDQGMSRDCSAISFTEQVCGTFSSFSENTRVIVPTGPASTVNRIIDGGTVRPFVTAQDGFNRNARRTLFVPLERFSFQTLLNYDVTPWANFFVEASYGRTESRSDLEPFPLGSDSVFGSLPFCDSATRDSDGDGDTTECFNGVNILNPFIPEALRQEVRSLNPGVSDDQLVVGFARRLTDIGNRGADAERQAFRFVTGFRGDINPDVSYEVAFNFARTTDEQNSSGQLNTANLLDAFDTALVDGQLVCADPGARSQGCVPVNLFGANTLTPEMANWIRAPSLRAAENQQVYAVAFLRGEHDIGFLPDKVGWVIGAEGRGESAEDVPDALTQTGQNGGNVAFETRGSFRVAEAFGELALPLLRDKPFARELDITGAARFSSYERGGTTLDTTAWAGGAEWLPFEGLRFRAQIARAVRAPNVGELFGPPGETFAVVSDPCAGVTRTPGGDPAFFNIRQDLLNPGNVLTSGINASTIGDQVAANCLADPTISQRVNLTGGLALTQPEVQGVGGFVNGGSIDLREETADTFTGGFVLSPVWDSAWTRRLTLSVDYYQIEIADGIGALLRQTSTTNCYSAPTFEPASAFCANVVRFAAGPSIGAIDQVNGNLQNLTTIETSGVDVQFSWGVDFADVGATGTWMEDSSLDFRVTYTHLLKFETVPFEGADVDDDTGEIGLPEDKGVVSVIYNHGPVTINWDASYIGETVGDNDPDGFLFGMELDSYWFHDAQVRLAIGDQHEVFFGVDNIFDEYVFVPGTNGDLTQPVGWTTHPDVYDGLGRRFTTGARLRF